MNPPIAQSIRNLLVHNPAIASIMMVASIPGAGSPLSPSLVFGGTGIDGRSSSVGAGTSIDKEVDFPQPSLAISVMT